jgi:chromosome segregation ATPase
MQATIMKDAAERTQRLSSTFISTLLDKIHALEVQSQADREKYTILETRQLRADEQIEQLDGDRRELKMTIYDCHKRNAEADKKFREVQIRAELAERDLRVTKVTHADDMGALERKLEEKVKELETLRDALRGLAAGKSDAKGTLGS